ncbi:hypothetical protein D3C71_1890040 [compost metagenome]
MRSHFHATPLATANSPAPIASHSPLRLSSGDSTPAMMELVSSVLNACIDEAVPRWRGYISRMSRLRIGKIKATPNDASGSDNTAHGTLICGTSAL